MFTSRQRESGFGESSASRRMASVAVRNCCLRQSEAGRCTGTLNSTPGLKCQRHED
jgi:hypothetical protein